jgi:cell division transport system ATP-binding protein
MIHFQHVTKTYEGQWKALDKVTLKIQKGEFVFLTGHSGAGKTTLLKQIYMEERPDLAGGGQVLVSFGKNAVFDSKTTPNSSIQSLRRKMGIVFQDFKLLPDRDVFENIAFALHICNYPTSKIQKRVYEVMTLAGISHRRMAYPQTLSGGEQQRVAVARAIANSPSILLADEPTGNLDPENALRIYQILKHINAQGTSIVMATHNPSIYGNSSFRRIKLEQGKILNKDLI